MIYAVSLLALIYHIYSKSGLIRYPFNRIIELCPVIASWITLASIAQMWITPDDSLGIYLCLVGVIIIPFAWG